MKKFLTLIVVFLFFGISIIPASGNYSFKEKSLKKNSVETINGLLPPLMWTDNFSTIHIKIPGEPLVDEVYYFIDWGDGVEEWIGPYNSNETISISHIWDEGEYQIKIKVKNQNSESKYAKYKIVLSSDYDFFGVVVGYVDIGYTFTFCWKAYDIYYIFIDWGDGSSEDWIGPYEGSEIIIFTHSWFDEPGEYVIKLRFKDEFGTQSEWITYIITILSLDNNPPDKPEGAGPCSGKSGIEYTFEFVTTDPDGDNVSYYFDWGDGNNTSWIGPFESGQAFAVAHTWYERGCYIIKCQAIDIWGDESEWLIHMFWIDRSKTLSYSLLRNFLEQYQPINLILQRLMINLQNK